MQARISIVYEKGFSSAMVMLFHPGSITVDYGGILPVTVAAFERTFMVNTPVEFADFH
jgi:hypothetical protein